MPVTIISPRPPLNLFEVARVAVTDSWTTIYDVPRFEVPAVGPTPLYYVETAAIATNLLIANTAVNAIEVSIRILDPSSNAFNLLTDLVVAAKDYAILDMERHVIKYAERLQVKCKTAGQTAAVHFSFILNQRERFEVLP